MLDDREFFLQWRTLVGVAAAAIVLWLVFGVGTVSIAAMVILFVAVFARNAIVAVWRWSRDA